MYIVINFFVFGTELNLSTVKLDIRWIHSQFYEPLFLVYPSLHWNSAFEITFVIYWNVVLLQSIKN